MDLDFGVTRINSIGQISRVRPKLLRLELNIPNIPRNTRYTIPLACGIINPLTNISIGLVISLLIPSIFAYWDVPKHVSTLTSRSQNLCSFSINIFHEIDMSTLKTWDKGTILNTSLFDF